MGLPVVLAQRAADIAIRVAFGNAVALVVLRLTAAQAELQLHPPVLEVDFQRDERVALPRHKPFQLADLALVHQKTLGTHGIAVEDVALLIGTDVHAFDPDLAMADDRPAFLEIHATLPHALDLGAVQLDPALVAFLHEIIVKRLAILCHGLDALLMRHENHILSRSAVKLL